MAATIDPTVLAQLARVEPSVRAAASDPHLASQFNDAAQRLTWQWSSTAMDVEDPDVVEACAVWSQRSLGGSVRRDEMPFFVVMSAIDWGWFSRVFERANGGEYLPADPVGWVASRLLPMTLSRSEQLGVLAQSFCLDARELAASTIGLEEQGDAVIEAFFLLWESHASAEGHGVDQDLVRKAHRLGMAIRTSTLALDTA